MAMLRRSVVGTLKVARRFPTCRCASWPSHKKSFEYSDIPPMDTDKLKEQMAANKE